MMETKGVVSMLVIKKEYSEYVNKTFRLPIDIIDTLDVVAKEKNTSLNRVVIQCLEYAIENMDRENEST